MDEMMQEQPWKVLALVDDAGRVVAINSNAFVRDTAGWVEIDEGFGDRYHHAQGHYLGGPLRDERGVYRYRLEDGAVMERTAAEMDADYTPPEEKPTAEERLASVEEALDMLLSGVTE